jgi:hypothetical protein
VTPWSVAPLAVPRPHGDASVPNFMGGAAVEAVAELVAVAAVVVAVVVLDDPRPLLHAARTSAPIRSTPPVRVHPTRPAIGPPPRDFRPQVCGLRI